jgi:hypothetical protein
MSDYNSSLPIRTETAGDVIIKVADATLPSQQLAVNADGSVNITDNGGSITVDGSVTVTATNLDIRDLSSSQDNVAISDGTDTLAVNADGSINVAFAAGAEVKITDGTDDLAVNADGSINSVVTATNLDIRDLTSASDSVSVLQATHDNLNANANLQVGDADVGNANPVPVSDAGGSLTVDATNLDIRDLVFATDKVDVSGSSVTVTATDLDVRDLSHSTDSVKIGDGTDFLAINADGSINVVPQEDAGTEVVDYDTASAVAGAATSNHDVLFTNGGKLYQVQASASGKMKIEVQIETGSATNTFDTVGVQFNSTANPNCDFQLAKYAAIPTGARVRVIRTNKEGSAQDLYSTIVGIEN